MKFFNNVLKINHDQINSKTQHVFSGCKLNNNKKNCFLPTESLSTVRHLLKFPELFNVGKIFFNVKYKLNGPKGSITHFSVVNSDVTDGCIWEVREPDNKGTFTVNGIIKAPLDNIFFYINICGFSEVYFKLEKITIVAIDDKPLKIAFVIDPWIERSEPKWKSDYIWWFGKIESTLKSSGHNIDTTYLMSDAVAQDWNKFKVDPLSKCSILSINELINLYGSHRKGIKSQRFNLQEKTKQSADLFKNKYYLDSKSLSAFSLMLRAALPWQPDVIIAMSDMQILKDAFPNALILYRDALYCREPFPDELTSFDYKGLYKNSSINNYISLKQPDDKLPLNFIDQFFPKSDLVYDLLDKYQLIYKEFKLLPLQDSNHYNFYDESNFYDQVDLIIKVANKFPNEKILITQHPDKKEINSSAIENLLQLYPNLVYIYELEYLKNPSAKVLPYAKGVIGVSTGILIQGLCLGLPIYFMGEHALKEVVNNATTHNERKIIAYYLLTRFYSSYRYLYDQKWFLTRIFSFMLLQNELLITDDMVIDLPANIFYYLDKDKRTND